MKIVFYPDENSVRKTMKENDPVFALISFDKKEVLVAPADDVVEHNIMLKKLNRSELDIDKYYRVVVNGAGADWTFVCPSDYKGISDKTRRIEQFYNDGIGAIDSALKKVGYNVEIKVPTRYRRHFNMMGDE
ncbi:MAG: hypothetical protein PHE88_12210 [Elusimicrobia bacterium]|nr:hypothetical protein [Elusimicrobiota bacterium]